MSVKIGTINPPRVLKNNETHDSLTQWKFQFNNFFLKDSDFKSLLKSSLTWDSSSPNYGFLGEGKEDKSDNLEILLGNLSGYLPFPYLTSQILKESRKWADVWSIIFSHYQAEPSQDTNLDFVSLQLNKADNESYLTFYERLCHHQRTHLAKQGAIIQGVVNPTDDQLTFSHQNLIAQLWMLKINPHLPSKVSVEFAAELQSGTQLAHLVPRVAKRVEQLLTLANNTSVRAVKQETDLQSDDTGPYNSEEVHKIFNNANFSLYFSWRY